MLVGVLQPFSGKANMSGEAVDGCYIWLISLNTVMASRMSGAA